MRISDTLLSDHSPKAVSTKGTRLVEIDMSACSNALSLRSTMEAAGKVTTCSETAFVGLCPEQCIQTDGSEYMTCSTPTQIIQVADTDIRLASPYQGS